MSEFEDIAEDTVALLKHRRSEIQSKALWLLLSALVLSLGTMFLTGAVPEMMRGNQPDLVRMWQHWESWEETRAAIRPTYYGLVAVLVAILALPILAHADESTLSIDTRARRTILTRTLTVFGFLLCLASVLLLPAPLVSRERWRLHDAAIMLGLWVLVTICVACIPVNHDSVAERLASRTRQKERATFLLQKLESSAVAKTTRPRKLALWRFLGQSPLDATLLLLLATVPLFVTWGLYAKGIPEHGRLTLALAILVGVTFLWAAEGFMRAMFHARWEASLEQRSEAKIGRAAAFLILLLAMPWPYFWGVLVTLHWDGGIPIALLPAGCIVLVWWGLKKYSFTGHQKRFLQSRLTTLTQGVRTDARLYVASGAPTNAADAPETATPTTAQPAPSAPNPPLQRRPFIELHVNFRS